ncbi:MAG: ribosome silencing factor [Aquiluna sp.]|nr:ribosome silencing factor [Aquiluna sp.]MCF8545205.1 ribosome silencing factor [Aquiluna sp.]
MPASSQTKSQLLVACDAARDKLGEDLVALDVTEPFGLAEVFLIVSAKNERQAQAMADNIEDELLKVGTKARFREGRQTGRWILLDFGDLIVHVMHEQEREFYSLERLWRDCPVVPTAA